MTQVPHRAFPLCSAALAAALTLLILSGAARAQSGLDEKQTRELVAELYLQGNFNGALEVARNFTTRLSDDTRKLQWLREIADLCIDARMPECAGQTIVQFIEVFDRTDSKDKEIVWRPFLLFAGYYYYWQVDDTSSLSKNNAHGILPILLQDPYQDPILYANAQVLDAEIYLAEGDILHAQSSITRLLAHTLSLDRRNAFNAAITLLSVVDLMIDSGDLLRASQIFSEAQPLFDRAFPPQSVQRFQYLELASRVAESQLNLLVASDTLQAALAALEKLQIEPDVARYRRSNLHSTLTMYQALSGDPASARRTLSKHPLWTRSDEIRKRGRFQAYSEFVFAAADIFSALLSGSAPDVTWKAALSNDLSWAAAYPRGRNEIESNRKFLLGLIELGEARAAGRTDRTAAADDMLYDAAKVRLELLDQLYSRSPETFATPSLTDRIVFTLALPSVAKRARADRSAVDLFGRLVDAINYVPQKRTFQALSLIARLTDYESRSALHSLFLLRESQSGYELRRLRELVQGEPLLSRQGSPNLGTVLIRSQIAEYEGNRTRLIEAVRTNTGPLQGRAVSLSEVQEALGENEAVLSYAIVSDIFVKSCIGKSGTAATWEIVDPAAVIKASQSLLLSLSATYLATGDGTAAFPLRDAAYLHGLLFRGLDECMRGKAHLFVSMPAALTALPVGALVPESDLAAAQSGDLSSLHWAGTSVAISYVASRDEVFWLRAIKSDSPQSGGFLGVGDPRLERFQWSGPSRSLNVNDSRRQEMLDSIATLDPLPDTGREILQADRTLHLKESAMLLGDEATEENVRALALDKYSIIAFATHGLVKGDIDGLDEAALVLTPGDISDSSDDGLLTASELASFELSASLVVLSACNTASADVGLFASEIRGISSGLAMAGVPSMLATLWSVDSASMEMLMAGFYDELRQSPSMTSAEALRRAAAAYLSSPATEGRRHPKYWAAAVLVGDGGRPVLPDPEADDGGHYRIDLSRPRQGEAGEYGRVLQYGQDIVATGIAAFDGKRFHAVLDILDRDGSMKSSRTLSGMGFGQLVRSGSGLFYAGYRLAAEDTGDGPVKSIPMLGIVGDDLKVAEVALLPLGEFGFVHDMVSDGAGGILAVLESAIETDSARAANIILLRRDRKGRISELLRERTEGWLVADGVDVSQAGDTIALSISRDRTIGVRPGQGYGFYGERNAGLCHKKGRTDFILLNAQTGLVTDRSSFEGSILLDINWGQKKAAGYVEEECSLDTHAALFDLSAQAPRVLWIDRAYASSTLRTVGDQSGSVLGFGTERYLMGLEDRYDLERRNVEGQLFFGTMEYLKNATAKRTGQDLYDSYRAFVLLKSIGGNVEKYIIRSGYPTSIGPADETEDAIVAGGSIGGMPAYFRISRLH